MPSTKQCVSDYNHHALYDFVLDPVRWCAECNRSDAGSLDHWNGGDGQGLASVARKQIGVD
jgi:hypothetical protein